MGDVRKNLIVLITVLSIILAVLLVLNFQKVIKQGQKAKILTDKSNWSDKSNLPIKLSRGPVKFFSLSGSDKIIFYENADQIIYEVNYDGRNKRELVRTPKGFQNIDMALAPSGEKIAYHFYNGSKDAGEIFLANLDGSEPISIFKTRIKKMGLLWPENDLIVFYPHTHIMSVGVYSTGQNGLTQAFSLKTNGKELKKLTEEETNFYLSKGEETKVLQGLGIETDNSKLSPLKDYLIFINAKDGKLYSLKL